MRIKIFAFASAFGILGCSGGGDGTSSTPTNPSQPQVGSIDVVLVPATTVVGGTATATATIRSTTGVALGDRTVTWTSSNSSIATIAGDGRITALASGATTITAATEGRSGAATLTVANSPVASVTIAPSSAQIPVGQSQTFAAALRDANGNVLTGRTVDWSSSNTGIALVSPSGAVTGVALGTVTVTATSEGRSGGAVVTITPAPVASVVVSPSSTQIGVGATWQFTATALDAFGSALSGRTFSWASSNASIATVSANGLVTALTAGTTTITASSEGRSGAATLTVSPTGVASVTVALGAGALSIGSTTTATATLRAADGTILTGRTLAWSSSNTSVATVSASGQVTAVSAGSTLITANSEGRSGSASITVTAPVASVVISPSVAQIGVGSTQQLTATALDAGGSALIGRTFTWTSSNASVASVSANGLVTALAVGTTTISANSEGRSGAATLTVITATVSSVTVSLGASTLSNGATTTATATLRAADGTILTGRAVTWSSSNASVATVSASGLVSAGSAGTTLITATSEGRSGSASLTVSTPVASVTMIGTQRAKVGETYSYSVQARDAAGNLLPLSAVFRLADPAAGLMTSAGVLVPQRTGSITIIVTVGGNDWTSTISGYDWQVGSNLVSLTSDERVTNQFGTSDYVDLVVSCSSGGFFFVWVSLPHFVTANGIVAYSFDFGSPIGQTWSEVSSFNALAYPGNNTLSRSLASTIAGSRTFGFAFGEHRSSTRSALFRPVGLSAFLPTLFSRCPSAIVAESDSWTSAVDGAKALRASTNSSSALLQAAEERAAAGPQAGADPSRALKAALRAPERIPMVRAR